MYIMRTIYSENGDEFRCKCFHRKVTTSSFIISYVLGLCDTMHVSFKTEILAENRDYTDTNVGIATIAQP